MQEKPIWLGLDVGTKTIGVAFSDALGMFAHPHSTIAREGVKKDCAKICKIAEEKGAQGCIVGLPLELDGSEERSARLARQIGEEMRQFGVVHYVDERFTSVQAERDMIRSGAKRDKRKAIIDQVAAVLILESYLKFPDCTET